MDSALKCKLRKTTQQQIEQSNSLLSDLIGSFLGSKLVLILSFLGLLGVFVYFAQSNNIESNEDASNNSNILNEQQTTETNNNNNNNNDLNKKIKKKKKKKNILSEEEIIYEELIVDNNNTNNDTPQHYEEICVSGYLNTIQELNENEHDSNFDEYVQNSNEFEVSNCIIQELNENDMNMNNDNNNNNQSQHGFLNDDIQLLSNEMMAFDNISNLINSITVTTQGKNDRVITISEPFDTQNSIVESVLHHDDKDNEITFKNTNQSVEMKPEVNIQYKSSSALQQININETGRYAEFDQRTRNNLFNDDFLKESMEDLSYDREEMGSKMSLQTDKTIDSSVDDLTNLDKFNKDFELIEKRNSGSDGSDKFDILDKNELTQVSSNENGFEEVNDQDEQVVENLDIDRVIPEEKIHDENNISENDNVNLSTQQSQSSINSLLSLYQAKHVHAIADNFHSLGEIAAAIQNAGLEKSQLIFGIDFTISNLENGKNTFHGRSLHYRDADIKNPYQKVIEILGKTLECFDIDGKIPAYGFGDSKTKDRKVFPFNESGYCDGFSEVLESYNRIVGEVQLSGPTNFAPLIKEAVRIVESTKQYHILVIVADGQVTNARQTRDAIVEASKHALSIVMVGVGDGPWDTMEEFDDLLPKREFDNFQFVNYHEVTLNVSKPDEVFALNALMEIPDQYKAIKELGLLNFDYD